MSNTCPTVRVKADNEQGFIVINESDFDEAEHELLYPTDSEGVKVMTAGQLRDALTAKGIDIPVGAKKADLRALLDAPQ